MSNNFFAVILAGGVGSRFWPVSKTQYPKQFIDMLGTGKSLLQQTYERFNRFIPVENIFIATHEQYADLVKEQLTGVTDRQLIVEPIMRNTAPCIAYASHKIQQLNPEAVMVVAPADHLILDVDQFDADLKNAMQTAQDNPWLITLGIKPTRPDTGYGYIQYASNKDTDPNAPTAFRKVKTFTEKPNAELAKTFLQSGDFVWNAGIFIWSATSIIDALAAHQTEMNDIFHEGRAVFNTDRESKFIEGAFVRCINISIDFAVMEKADNVYVQPVEFGWSDLGTWSSVYELSDKDYLGNVSYNAGQVITYDTSNCMIRTQKDKVIILKGLQNYIVVDTPEALMICPKDQEQEVKTFVNDVKEKFGDRYI